MSGSEQNVATTDLKKDVPTIPNQCVVASSSKHQSIIICTPKSEDVYTQIAPTVPSLVVSILAIILSVSSLSYTYKKDKKSRRHSIEDDFWIRKVLSPSSIEELHKFTTSTTSELTHQSLNGALSKQIKNTFGQDSLSRIRMIACAFEGLALISCDLSAKVATELELYEDCLANFYGKVLLHNATKSTSLPPPSVSEVTASLNVIQNRIFGLIKDHQFSS